VKPDSHLVPGEEDEEESFMDHILEEAGLVFGGGGALMTNENLFHSFGGCLHDEDFRLLAELEDEFLALGLEGLFSSEDGPYSHMMVAC